MKRGNQLNLLIIFSILLILSIPLVSAGFFSDVNSWFKDLFDLSNDPSNKEDNSRSISGFAHLTDSGTDEAWCQGADIDKDGKVSYNDQVYVDYNLGRSDCNEYSSYGPWCYGADINKDEKVNSADQNIIDINWQRDDCEPFVPVCTDTDNGKDSFVKGTTSIDSNTHTDICDKESVVEYYCSFDSEKNISVIKKEDILCKFGCQDGACLVKEIILGEAWCKGADINKDGSVDSKDQNLLGIYWQKEDCVKTNDANSYCQGSDINQDGKVDIKDQNILGVNWQRDNCEGFADPLLKHCTDNICTINLDEKITTTIGDKTYIIGLIYIDLSRVKLNVNGVNTRYLGEGSINIFGDIKIKVDGITYQSFDGGVESVRLSFSEFLNATISIATLKDVYKIGEKIELTDPPDEIEDLETINTKNINARVIDDINPNREIITRDYPINDYPDINDNYQNGEIYNFQGDISERDFNQQQIPKSNGFIVQYKDPSVIETANTFYKKAEKSKGFIEEYPILSTITLYRFFATTTDKVSGKVAKYSEDLDDKNKIVNKRILNKLNKERASKITAYAISEPEEVKIINEFDVVFNGIVLDINEEEAEEIKKIRGVKSVTPNYKVYATLMDSVPLINADNVWNLDVDGGDCSTTGKDCLTGEGVTIGILDTGIDYTHEDLGGSVIEETRDFEVVLDAWDDNTRGETPGQAISLDQGRVAYALNNKIHIYSFITGEILKIPTIEGRSPLRVILKNNFLIYTDSWEIFTPIYLYNLNTLEHLIIEDRTSPLIINNDYFFSPGLVKIENNKIIYNFGDTYDVALDDVIKHLHVYDIVTKERKQLLGEWDFIHPFAVEDNKIYYIIITESGSRQLVIYDLLADNYEYKSLPDLRNVLDVQGDEIVYSISGVDYRVYNLKTDEYFDLNFDLGVTTQESEQISLGYITRTESPFILRQALFGDDIIVYSKHDNSFFRKTIFIYDRILDRVVQLSLDDESNDFSVEGKRICFDSVSDNKINCHIYDPNNDYTIPEVTFNSKVIGGYDFANNNDDPMDDHGHGTHVAATAAGNGILKGVAPDAKLYAYKVLNAGGSGWSDDIISAIERSIDPNQDGDFSDSLDIISLSFGGSGDPDDPTSRAIDNAVESGVIAVVSAGNCGPGANPLYCSRIGDETIGSPGTARKAITVGASDKNNLIAGFSSRGSVRWFDKEGNIQFIVKPDIVAPGVKICAAQWNDAWDNRKCLDDNHVSISGTSMAAPIVSGAAALLKQKYPDWTPEEIKMILRNTAVDIGKEINTQGHGRIDVFEAISKGKPLIADIQPNEQIEGDELIDIEGSALGEDFESYSLYYGLGVAPEEWIEIITSDNTIEKNILYSNFDTSLISDGLNYIRLTVRKKNGEISEDYGVLYRTIPDIGGSRRITTNSYNQVDPDIYGDKIVWQDDRNRNWDIYMYDLSTREETQITSNTGSQSSPDIYGDKIVWEDDRNGNWDVYMYDILTGQETQITYDFRYQINPDIYENKIVWEDDRNRNWDIYMYDLITKNETPIIINPYDQVDPDIYGDKIVWQDDRNGNLDVYMYDLSTRDETQITSSLSSQRYQDIHGDKIVWRDYRNGKPNIYMYDISTGEETQITTNPSNKYSPDIYGDKIVWQDGRNGYNGDIYMYDISTGEETRITSNTAVPWNAKIYGDKIVWHDDRNGRFNGDIYIYDLSGCTPKCTGKDCGDDGCGGSCGICSESTSCNENKMCINTIQSKIVNNANSDLTGTLTMTLQRKISDGWIDEKIVVNQQITIPANELLKLDIGKDSLGNQVFAGWNNLNVFGEFADNYRVYAKFTDSQKNIIENTWEFKVKT